MKRILFYLSVILFSVMLGFILERMKPKKVGKLLSIDTEYAYLMEKDAIGMISFYVNQTNHPVVSKDDITRMILRDQRNISLIELQLYMIEKGHEEVYLNEHFAKYALHFMMPSLSEDWVFEDAHLTIELLDQREYTIKLGRLTFFTPSMEESYLDWTSLEGKKAKNDLRSRLHTITITYAGEIKPIEKIMIGTKVDLMHEITLQLLTIHIPNDTFTLYHVPVIICYLDGSKDTLYPFPFFTDYHMLKESGPMINVYQLD